MNKTAQFSQDCKDQKEQKVELPATQMTIEEELTKRMPELISNDRFMLVVQPVVDLKTNEIVGGEVLSRLNHPEQGMIFPNKFIPAIEEAGLISEFDYYIFGKACDLVSRITNQGINIQYLSCNFSRKTLSEKGITTRLSRIAENYRVMPDHLAVEIMEQEPETNTEQFYRNLQELKDAGFRIFVDDMGAGVTSDKDLWSYPVDVVKIDRSMLLAAETEQGRVAYQGLQNLAAGLGYKSLGEGVETEDQRQFVQNVGCHYCQGFLFFRPMEEQQFVQLMRDRS